jgi:hypothetical protein
MPKHDCPFCICDELTKEAQDLGMYDPPEYLTCQSCGKDFKASQIYGGPRGHALCKGCMFEHVAKADNDID